MSDKFQIGLIGCGNISDVYCQTLAAFDFLQIAACADRDMDRARAKRQKWSIPRACSIRDLLNDDQIQCVINLTPPQAHAPVMLACLEAGKHVYTEKPFGVCRQEGLAVIELARRKGLRVGCAPDTILGASHQSARKLIDDGAIGTPVAATAFMACHGHEHWHPAPQFLYQPGGGPLFDMGPYYLTDLMQLMGPVAKVAAMTRTTFSQRTITSAPFSGQTIQVQVPTHVCGSIQFASGATATVLMSFDVWGHHLPHLEIHGTEGSLFVPDPNCFDGLVLLQKNRSEPLPMPWTHGYSQNSRGLGLAEMIRSIQVGRDHRCNERLAYHVLDVMQAFYDSSDQNAFAILQSTCDRPTLLPEGLRPGELD